MELEREHRNAQKHRNIKLAAQIIDGNKDKAKSEPHTPLTKLKWSIITMYFIHYYLSCVSKWIKVRCSVVVGVG